MKVYLRKEALRLRKEGLVLAEIASKLDISKSTASIWLRKYPLDRSLISFKNKENGRRLGAIQHKNKIRRVGLAISEARTAVGNISKRDLMMLGIGIYIGEGTKWENIVRIVNSDPKVIRLSVRWLQEVFGVKKSNLYLRIHGYPDTDFEKAIDFWSKETGISKNNFQSHVIDRRKGKSTKRGTLPFGTAHLNVVGDKRGEISLGLQIRKWMEVVLD
jgi:hypothetical protein